MRKFLLIAVLLPFFSVAQNTFRINYDVANFDIPINSTEALTQGNYVFSGFHANFIPFVSSLTEINGTGNIVWAKRYSGGTAFNFGDFKRDNALNRYYACGGSSSGPAFLLFIDATGNLISGKNFSISQADGAHFNKVVKTSDGGYICVGYVTGYDPDGAGAEVKFSSVTNNDASCNSSHTETIESPLMVKFDANGDHVWHQVLRYYVTSATPANRIYNDATFVDVVEVSDGYIAIGSYDVNNVFSTFNSDCEDTTPTDALFFKTTTAGAITFHRQIDNPSNSTSQSSKSLASISKTSTGLPLISGSDGSSRPLILMRLAGSGGWANPAWIRKYAGAQLFPFGPYAPLLPSRFFETSDGNYAVWSNYINLTNFSNVLLKINSSTSASIWARQHAFNFASIFPYGEQVSDGGYIGVSYTLAGTGHDMHFIKTDVNGNAPSTCAAGNVTITNETPSYTYGTPIYNNWNANTVTNNSITPTVTNITPASSIVCQQISCTPPPNPTVNANPSEICAGQSVIINASGSGVTTYNVYANASGGTALGSTPYTVTPTADTTFYVEAVDNSDPTCVSARVPVTITVNALPTITIGSNSPICEGNDLNLTADGGTSYSWTGPGSYTSGVQNPTITNATSAHSGDYEVTVTDGNSCTNTATVTVSVLPPPTALITGNNEICAGESTTLTASGGGTYSWSTTETTEDIIVSPTQDSTFWVIVSVGTCTDSTGISVTVKEAPEPNASANTPLCEGDTLFLTSSGGGNYAWAGPSFNGTQQNDTISNVTAANAGTYTVTVTGSNNCFATADVEVVINPLPTVTASNTGPVCEGGTIDINATGGTTFIWNGPNSFSGNDATHNINNISPADTGTYTVVVTDANNCSASASTLVEIYAAPDVQFAGNLIICTGESTTITASGGTSFSWNTGDNTADISVSPTNDTYYVVIVTDGNNCSATDSVLVTVLPPPTAQISGGPSVCIGSSVTLTASGGNDFLWSTGEITASISVSPTADSLFWVIVSSGNCIDSTAINITVNPLPNAQITGEDTICSGESLTLTASGGMNPIWNSGQNTSVITVNPITDSSFTVTVTNINGCSNSATHNVNVNPLPNVQITGNTVICQGDSTSLTATGANSYVWSTGPTSSSITVNPSSPTSYTVTGTDANGCSASTQATVNVLPPPQIIISDPSNVCMGETIILVASGAGNYTWSNGETADSIMVTIISDTTFSVIGFYGNCSDSASISLTPTPLPVITISNDTTILHGNSVTLVASGGTSYSWEPSFGLSCTTCPNPIASPEDTTTYCVTVTQNGCSDTACVTVRIDFTCGDVFVPTAFSPNGDGNNDCLQVYGNCVEDMVFQVYSRWGELVFETSNPDDCWDGTHRGKEMNTAVFVYILTAVLRDGQTVQLKGNVSLIK
jgi:gliding motility-associated-like protein